MDLARASAWMAGAGLAPCLRLHRSGSDTKTSINSLTDTGTNSSSSAPARCRACC